MTKKRVRKTVEARLLAIGLDNSDGHVRITQGKNFSAFFGSEETHGRMQEFCIKFTEKLDRKGKQLSRITRREFNDIAADLI